MIKEEEELLYRLVDRLAERVADAITSRLDEIACNSNVLKDINENLSEIKHELGSESTGSIAGELQSISTILAERLH